MLKIVPKVALLFSALAVFMSLPAMAQDATDTKPSVERNDLPQTAKDVNAFVLAGWKIENDVTGELNQDGIPDHALTLIEATPEPKADEPASEGNRVMLVVLGSKGGTLNLASVSGTLLQCASCGGAFYGVSAAPANVSIEKGVLIVQQDHGSRWVTDTTYRFRYDEQPSMFILIGFDYSSRDRAEGSGASESTNYLTGKRVTTTSKGGKNTTKTTMVKKMRYSLEEVDSAKFDEDATKRLGVD